MIAKILVAQRQTEDPLRQHLREPVLDQQRRSAIDKAARQPPQQVDLALHLAQQQRTAVAGNLTSGKSRLHTARKMGCKSERFLSTLCHQRPLLFIATNFA